MMPDSPGWGSKQETDLGTLLVVSEENEYREPWKGEPGNYQRFFSGLAAAIRNQTEYPWYTASDSDTARDNTCRVQES